MKVSFGYLVSTMTNARIIDDDTPDSDDFSRTFDTEEEARKYIASMPIDFPRVCRHLLYSCRIITYGCGITQTDNEEFIEEFC